MKPATASPSGNTLAPTSPRATADGIILDVIRALNGVFGSIAI